jgi:hypothetical protein
MRSMDSHKQHMLVDIERSSVSYASPSAVVTSGAHFGKAYFGGTRFRSRRSKLEKIRMCSKRWNRTVRCWLAALLIRSIKDFVICGIQVGVGVGKTIRMIYETGKARRKGQCGITLHSSF